MFMERRLVAFAVGRPPQGKTASDCAARCWLMVVCCANGHSRRFGAEEMGFPPETRLEDIAQRLICSQCGGRECGLNILNDAAAVARRIADTGLRAGGVLGLIPATAAAERALATLNVAISDTSRRASYRTI